MVAFQSGTQVLGAPEQLVMPAPSNARRAVSLATYTFPCDIDGDEETLLPSVAVHACVRVATLPMPTELSAPLNRVCAGLKPYIGQHPLRSMTAALIKTLRR